MHEKGMSMTREDLNILCLVSERICGRGLAMSGARSDFRRRCLNGDARDARIFNGFNEGSALRLSRPRDAQESRKNIV